MTCNIRISAAGESWGRGCSFVFKDTCIDGHTWRKQSKRPCVRRTCLFDPSSCQILSLLRLWCPYLWAVLVISSSSFTPPLLPSFLASPNITCPVSPSVTDFLYLGCWGTEICPAVIVKDLFRGSTQEETPSAGQVQVLVTNKQHNLWIPYFAPHGS